MKQSEVLGELLKAESYSAALQNKEVLNLHHFLLLFLTYPRLLSQQFVNLFASTSLE